MIGDIGELETAEIAEQSAVAVTGEAEVEQSIVVKVAGGNTVGDSLEFQLGCGGDVTEGAIGVLLHQLQQRGGVCGGVGGGESCDEQVREVIIIEVCDGGAAGHDEWEQPCTGWSGRGGSFRLAGGGQCDDLEPVQVCGSAGGVCGGQGLWRVGLAAAECEDAEQGRKQEASCCVCGNHRLRIRRVC